MAPDFNVNQSQKSRWERGLRETSLRMKQAILNEKLDSGQAGPGHTIRLKLEQRGSAVAVWSRDGTLLGATPLVDLEALLDNDGKNRRIGAVLAFKA